MPDAPASHYHRVFIRRAAAVTCCGNAHASLDACLAGRSGLRYTTELGWHGRAGDRDGLLALALRSARRAAEVLRPGEDLPVLSFSVSKGDTGLLVPDTLHPEALPLAQIGAFLPRLARALGIPTYLGSSPVAACSTGLYALLEAADAIESGRAQRGLAGAADASLQPVLLAGFRALGVLCKVQPEAFSGAGTGFAPAEGSACLALDAHDGIWQLLAGVRLGDAGHPTRCTDPAAIRACLSALWDVLPEPDCIVAHATGTVAGDAYELCGLDDGPWRDCMRLVCKPTLGHCLGASGIVELASALHGPWTTLWKLSFGFGGHMAAVALRRV